MDQDHALAKRQIDDAFTSFMDQDAIKLLVSMIPRAESPETLHALLKSAFVSGFACGTMTTTALAVAAALRDKGAA